MSAILEKLDLSDLLVSVIRTAPENDLIYDRFGIANADDRALTISIRDNGIQEPLAVSADHFLLSGHRRLAAARYLGIKSVPVRLVDVVFQSLDKQTKLETLRRFNQQREKSPGERIREKMLEINPDEAHKALVSRKIKAREKLTLQETNVSMGIRKKRAKITTLQFLEKVKQVIEENREYWPLTVRRVHYLLLNDPPLRHDKKPDSKYVNTLQAYKGLSDLLTRARLAGDVPMDSIEDPTRPIQDNCGFSSFEAFVGQETRNFLTNYARDLMQGQPNHVEIMLEKSALRSVIDSVAWEYRIPCTTGRGFTSIPPRRDLAQRYFRSGKAGLILLMLTDFDPDGDQIASSFGQSMRDDFKITNVKAIKVALTAEDIETYDLPSDLGAKVTSPNYQKFLKRYGSTKVVELDAAPVTLLQSKLREAIESVIDIEEFNAQVDIEKQDSAHIEAHRRVVFDAIQGAT